MSGMDADLRETVIRLEGKVDTIGTRVGGEMTALTRHIETLVEMLRLQIRTTQEDVGEIKGALVAERHAAADEVSKSRVDLERQIHETRSQVSERYAEIVKRLDESRGDRKGMYDRLDSLDRSVNRLYGGLGLAAALGMTGLVALLRGLT